MSQSTQNPNKTESNMRKKRLGQQLRANLQRRKAQARVRKPTTDQGKTSNSRQDS